MMAKAQEPKVEEIQVPEAPKEVLSFKGLTACPNCKKEMKMGIAMHYKHCIKKA